MYKLFTKEWLSDLIITVGLSLVFLSFIFTILTHGFTFNNLLNSVIVLLVIGYFIARSFLKETPLIESMYAVYLLGFVILGLGGIFVLIQMFGYGFAFLYLIGCIFLFSYLLKWQLDKKQKQSNDQVIRTNYVSPYSSVGQKIYYAIYSAMTFSKRRREEKETNEVIKKGQEKRKILADLGFSDFDRYTISDKTLGMTSDDEFDNLINILNERKEKEIQLKEKRQREEKETNELIKRGQEKRKILENLGWGDFNKSMPSNNQLGAMSDDEFNNLIKNFNEQKEKEIQLKQSLIYKV